MAERWIWSYRDRVFAEARKQRELRAAGQPVPLDYQRYARLSGVILFLVGSAAVGGVLLIARSGSLFIGAMVIFAGFAVLGLAQLVTGRHLLTGR